MIDNSHINFLILFIANYLITSTILIGFVWCVTKTGVIKSVTLIDHLWKFSIFTPLLLVCLQPILVGRTYSINLAGSWNEPAAVPAGLSEQSLHSQHSTFASGTGEQSMFSAFEASEVASTASKADQKFEQTALPGTDSGETQNEVELPPSVRTNELMGIESTTQESLGTGASINEAFVSKSSETGLGTFLKPSRVLNVIAFLIVFMILFGILKTGFELWYTSQRLKCCEYVESDVILNCLTNQKQRMNLHQTVTLWQVEKTIEPAACGILNWSILLPRDLDQKLNKKELEALLAHELSHCQRYDPLWSVLTQTIKNCFFWQPFNLFAIRCWKSVAEQCCDAQAVHSGIDRLTLARCLTNVASWKCQTHPVLSVGVTASALGERIERLVENAPPIDLWREGWRRHLRWSLACTAIVFVFFGAPRLSWTLESQATLDIEPHDTQVPDTAPTTNLVNSISSMAASQQGFSPGATLEERQLISQQIEHVANDLGYALRLLQDQEHDPEILETVRVLEHRIQVLQERSSKLWQDSLSSTDVSTNSKITSPTIIQTNSGDME